MAEIGSALAALEGLKTAWELVRSAVLGTSVLRAERKAGQNPFSINRSALEASFDGTLSRLQAVDETWGRCEAVCIDDRFVTRHTTVTDRNGKTVPILTTVDLLRSLRLAGRLQDSEWFGMLHGLRECGSVLIPVEADELVSRLRSATLDAEGPINETYELRIIRQYFAIIHGREVVKSDEIDFLTRLGLAAIVTP